ncbi:MAG: 3-phosphoglycerate dehydrogenase, partial [Tannerellaceae bacterium]
IMQSRKDFVFLADTKPLIDEQLKTEFPTRYYATPKKMGAQTEEANTNAGVAAAIQIVNFFKTGDEHFRVNL